MSTKKEELRNGLNLKVSLVPHSPYSRWIVLHDLFCKRPILCTIDKTQHYHLYYPDHPFNKQIKDNPHNFTLADLLLELKKIV